jgi:uncharacterized protein DUF4440
MKRSRLAAVLCSGLVGGMALAGQAAADSATMEPSQVVSAFHTALSSGSREQALALLSPEVVIFESGGAETSRDEYGSHHLGGDMEFVRATKTTVVDEQSGQSADAAWVLRRTTTTGQFRGKAINSRSTETMILRKGAAGWLITHIHWSSHTPK